MKKKLGNVDKSREQCYRVAVGCLIEAVKIEDTIKRLKKAIECAENLKKCLDELPKPKHVDRQIEMLKERLQKAGASGR